MAQANFTVSPLSGYVFATEFKINNLTEGPVKEYIWNFGFEELIYNIKEPSYIYNIAGTYNIILSAIDFNNNITTFTQTVTVDFLYRDFLTFTQIPDTFSVPGVPTKTPFQITVVSLNFDKPLIVDLFAANSNSTPYQFIPNKWNFLTPTWKFLDKNFNTITSLSIEPTPIYKDDKIVAVSGTGEFYYVDSNTTGYPVTAPPILITATLQTSGFVDYNDSNIFSYPSYANNKSVCAGLIWQVDEYFPNFLKVTGNYIDNINTLQWSDVKIPVLITCHANRSILLPGSDSIDSEVLFTYPNNNQLGKLTSVQLSISGLTPDMYTVDEAPLYFQSTDKDGYRTGGYIFTTITPLTSIGDTSIVVEATIHNDIEENNKNIYPYPQGYAPSPAVWISNPLKNTLNKITLIPYLSGNTTIEHFKKNNTLVDGIIKEIPIPLNDSTATYNYSMSGFSGIYGIAIDPRKHDVVACDAELDCLYRFDTTGKLLKTFKLSSLETFNPFQKFFNSWSWLAPSPALSSSRYGFYGPELLSSDLLNYLVIINNEVISTVFYEIDIYERMVRTTTFDYPPENATIDTIQIFSPTLSANISTLYNWSIIVNQPTNVLTLTNNPFLDALNKPFPTFLNNNSSSYLVFVNGKIQRPETYTINSGINTISFETPLQNNTGVYILYIPSFIDSKSWTLNLSSTNVNVLSVSQLPNFNNTDANTGIFVNVDNEIILPNKYRYISDTGLIQFNDFLPIDKPICITQHNIEQKVYTPIAYTPTYVSLDKDYNIWVTLFNTVSVLKFDENFNFLFSVVPENIEWQFRAWINLPTDIGYQSAQFKNTSIMFVPEEESLDPYTNEFFLKPPVAETDKDNNCWVTYANPLCCLLVKYSSTGNLLTQINLPDYTIPINLAVDINNNVWVANFHGSSYTYTPLSGSIQLFDTNTHTIIKSISGISRPGLLSVDRDNNLWFTHSLRRIGFYNTTTDTLSTWTLDPTDGLIPYPSVDNLPVTALEFFDVYENRENEEIGGLAIDVYNRLWIIDNTTNKIWVLSATPNFENTSIRHFAIRPNSTIGYYVDPIDANTFTKQYDSYSSAQATGDWTGNKWYQKYLILETLSSTALTAVSNNFSIEEFTNKNQISRINESFNLAGYLKSLALPEILQNNTTFFDKFLSASVGSLNTSSEYEDLGQILYEKIANFVINHSDIDTCNVAQLLSLAQKTDVTAFDYATEYPLEIKNLLNIGSIDKTKLWGVKNITPSLQQSIGKLYNTETDIISSQTKVIFKNKFNNQLNLVTVPTLLNETVYPISSINIPGFADLSNYLIYKYEPKITDNDYIENIIDWTSNQTTLSQNLTTINDWTGKGKSLENGFRYLLTKNLFHK